MIKKYAFIKKKTTFDFPLRNQYTQNQWAMY